MEEPLARSANVALKCHSSCRLTKYQIITATNNHKRTVSYCDGVLYYFKNSIRQLLHQHIISYSANFPDLLSLNRIDHIFICRYRICAFSRCCSYVLICEFYVIYLFSLQSLCVVSSKKVKRSEQRSTGSCLTVETSQLGV